MINIALDAMGGDFYPHQNIEGALLALKEFPNLSITLVGPEDALQKELEKQESFPKDRLLIHNATEVIEMTDSPSKAFRQKKDSTIHEGLRLVKDNKSHGFVSAGNTGAVLTASTLILGRVKNVDRPGLASVFPSANNPYVVIDLGSNVDCKPEHLQQFAIMGHAFSNLVLEVENPKVGLLNIGDENNKGNMLTQATFELLEKAHINFIGNVEAKAINQGIADVVVCDGFVGNNVLKFGEGVIKLFMNFLKNEAKTSFLSLIGLLFLKPAFKRFRKKFDYDEYGGAHLLGVNGISVIAHGSAGATAIKNAVKVAMLSYDHHIVEKIDSCIQEDLVTTESKSTLT